MALKVLIQIPGDTEEILMGREREREGQRRRERGERENSLGGKKIINLNQQE